MQLEGRPEVYRQEVELLNSETACSGNLSRSGLPSQPRPLPITTAEKIKLKSATNLQFQQYEGASWACEATAPQRLQREAAEGAKSFVALPSIP